MNKTTHCPSSVIESTKIWHLVYFYDAVWYIQVPIKNAYHYFTLRFKNTGKLTRTTIILGELILNFIPIVLLY